MKLAPVFAQDILYCEGKYNQCNASARQSIVNPSVAKGLNAVFLNSYNVLKNMASMTTVTDNQVGSFLMMSNDTTHDVALLQEPDYIPAQQVDNTSYDAANKERFTVDGRTLSVEDAELDVENVFPLLMAKDFNATEFTTSDEFMTNADVPMMAVKDIIEEPTNPMTGNPISNDEKTAHEQYIIVFGNMHVSVNNGNTFSPSRWYSVHDSIWDKDNWTKVAEDAVLPIDSE